MGLWENYGLAPRRLLTFRSVEPRFASLTRPHRFRLALEERGGLFPVFAQFLAGRADLLSSDYLPELRKIRLPLRKAPSPSSDREFAKRLSGFQPLRQFPCSEAYRAGYQERPIVVEMFSQASSPPDEKTWNQFSRQIRQLEDGPEAPAIRWAALAQFHQWLQLQGDLERKRTILENLRDVPAGCVSRFPRLIPELQSARFLAYEALEGTPLTQDSPADSSGNSKELELLAEGVLEQSLLLSLVDSEACWDNYVVLSDGALGFRSVPAFAAVPVERHYELLQYATAAAAGDRARAVRMFSRILAGGHSEAAEHQLAGRLSSLRPELRAGGAPRLAGANVFENYWRAMASAGLSAPLFFDLFHRHLTLLGEYEGGRASSEDLVRSALWPVLGRILRFRVAESFTPQKAQEWANSSALLLLGGFRQAAAALEQTRDRNPLAWVLERKESQFQEARRNRRAAALIRAVAVLAAFIFAVQWWVHSASASHQILAAATAVVSAAALVRLVAGME